MTLRYRRIAPGQPAFSQSRDTQDEVVSIEFRNTSGPNMVRPTTTTVVGIVRRADTGQPLGNATVSLEPGGLSAVTSRSGSFEIAEVEAGTYTRTVIADGFLPTSTSLDVTPTTDGRVEVVLLAIAVRWIGNRRSKELHLLSCSWLRLMSPRNRVDFGSLEDAIEAGYNGCHFCMPEIDTDDPD